MVATSRGHGVRWLEAAFGRLVGDHVLHPRIVSPTRQPHATNAQIHQIRTAAGVPGSGLATASNGGDARRI